jgi:hypothetical protein
LNTCLSAEKPYFITFTEPQLSHGKESTIFGGGGWCLAFFAATAVNIKDLYEMLQTSINLMASFRKQIDLISERAENLSESVKDVKQQYDHTLGSLKDRLNKINKGDEEKKKQNRGIPFYG